jgi:DNA-binding CsgD family transcriptional regulator
MAKRRAMTVGETTQAAADSFFVGRARELSFVRSSLEELWRGPLRVVWVEGAAGSGKSALLREALRSVPPEVLVLRAVGDEQERLVDGAFLGQLLGSLDPELVDGRPGILELPSGRATAVAAGAATLEVLGTILGARPLLLVLDDLHWADRLSLDVLRFVLRRLRADPVGLIAALRSEEVPAVGEAWLRLLDELGDGRAVTLELGGLDVDDAKELWCRRWGSAPSADRLVELVRQTGGSALYLSALASEVPPEVVESGQSPLVSQRLGVVLLARLERLEVTVRALVEASAVLELASLVSDLVHVARAGYPELGPVDLKVFQDAVAQACRAGLLSPGLGSLRSGPLRITHPLLARAVYDALSVERRVAMHSAACALRSGRERLRHQVAASVQLGHTDEALALELERAASEAFSALSPGRSAELLHWAASVTPAGPDRDRRVLEAVLALVLGAEDRSALEWRGVVLATAPSPRRTLALAALDLADGEVERSLSRLDELALADVPAPLRSLAHLQRALVFFGRGDWVAALEASKLAVVLGRGRPGLPSSLAQALLALALGAMGRFREADEVLASTDELGQVADADVISARGLVARWSGRLVEAHRELLALFQNRLGVRPGHLYPLAAAVLAEVEVELGEWGPAAIHAELAMDLVDLYHRRWVMPVVASIAATVHALRGDGAACRRCLDRLGEPGPRGWWIATYYGVLGQAHAAWAEQRWEDVLRSLAAVDAEADRLGAIGFQAASLLRVEAHARLGDPVAASSALARVEALAAAQPVSGAQQLELARVRALAAASAGRLSDAAQCLEGALSDAQASPWFFRTALAELDLARILSALGNRHRSLQFRTSARRRLGSLGALPWLESSEGALALGEDGSITTSSLSPQQREVVRLVCHGATNRQIAQMLFVSPKTVEYHLNQIFSKLGVGSRRELILALEER